jgi:mannose-6-phosphate isomerase-like protein (cupin superfamily)
MTRPEQQRSSSDEPAQSTADPHTAIAPISIANTEHYHWGDRCQAWFLLKSSSLTVLEEEMPPGASESLHFHRQARQLFYILEGKASMEMSGESIEL